MSPWIQNSGASKKYVDISLSSWTERVDMYMATNGNG